MLDYLFALSPIEFEHAVVRLLPHLGYADARRTGGAGDLGVDIVCYDEDGGLVAVQCKRYAVGNNVTSPNIQQFFGMLVHHGARHGVYVTTSSFTKGAFALAAARDIRTIAGTELASLFAAHPEALGIVQTPGPASVSHPDIARLQYPSVPLVVPDFYSDRAVHAAREAQRAWLSQLSPDTPVITAYQSKRVLALTEEQQRAWRNIRERLVALTPDQFRKVCILSFVDLWERDKPTIRLLEHENPSIKDYVVMHRQQSLQPSISRCHHLPAEHTVTFEQVDRVIRFAGANGCDTAQYWTTGLFSAGALIRAHHHDFGGAAVDGGDIALSLLPEIQGLSTGKDFVALSQQPGWPTKVLEGTHRRGLLRRLFG